MKSNLFLMSAGILIVALANICVASEKCDYAGIQTVLRDSADELAGGIPVRYVDFTDHTPFSQALEQMRSVGVSDRQVQEAWAPAINRLCAEGGKRVTLADLGPSQTLSGLSERLGVSE